MRSFTNERTKPSSNFLTVRRDVIAAIKLSRGVRQQTCCKPTHNTPHPFAEMSPGIKTSSDRPLDFRERCRRTRVLSSMSLLNIVDDEASTGLQT
ncbi:hypothetical protein KEM48_003308 [Puccinia striiformis f. sp. tritici PST-130]|nr:hypothetical protein KEM48_003308 [Puccinia striiformis f. sp. tritici PST-130]